MDVEKLEKLHELKEKGILSEEEFNLQKAELLSNVRTVFSNSTGKIRKKGVSWENVGISFFVATIWSLIAAICLIYSFNLALLYIFISALCMCGVAMQLNTSKYENSCSEVFVFIGVLGLGGIGVWIIMYLFLQIGCGNLALKKHKKEVRWWNDTNYKKINNKIKE